MVDGGGTSRPRWRPGRPPALIGAVMLVTFAGILGPTLGRRGRVGLAGGRGPGADSAGGAGGGDDGAALPAGAAVAARRRRRAACAGTPDRRVRRTGYGGEIRPRLSLRSDRTPAGKRDSSVAEIQPHPVAEARAGWVRSRPRGIAPGGPPEARTGTVSQPPSMRQNTNVRHVSPGGVPIHPQGGDGPDSNRGIEGSDASLSVAALGCPRPAVPPAVRRPARTGRTRHPGSRGSRPQRGHVPDRRPRRSR